MAEENMTQTPNPTETNQSVNDEPVEQKPVKVKKRHGVLKGFLLFFGGFLTCLVAVGGTLAIVGATVPVQQVVNVFGANLDLSKYLTAEYANDTVLQLITHAMHGDFNIQNLYDLLAITPLVEEYYQKIDDLIYQNIGVHLDQEGLFSVSFEEIGDYIATYARENITLAAVLNVNEQTDSKVLIYICYKKDSNGNIDFNSPRSLDELMAENAFVNLINAATLNDLVDVGEEGVLWALRNSTLKSIKDDVNTIKLKDLIGITDQSQKPLPFIGQYTINEILDGALTKDATMGDLFDLKEGDLLYHFKDSTMDSLQEDIKDAKLKDIMTIITDKNDPDYNPTLYALRDATLNTIGEDVNNLKVHEMIEINDESSQVLKYFRDYNGGEGVALKHLDDAVKAMTLGDAIFIDEDDPNTPQILLTLKGSLITELSKDINNLTLGQAIKIDDNSSSLMQKLAGTNINDLDKAINNMPLSDLIGFDEDDPNTPKILRLIADLSLNNIEDKVEDIYIKDLFTDDGASSTNNKLLDALPYDTTLRNFKSKLAEVKIVDAFTEDIWGSNAELIARESVSEEEEKQGKKGDIIGGYINDVANANLNYSMMDKTWRYMLTSKDDHGTYLHTEYHIMENMNDLTKNMQDNISSATIRELNNDGFIEISDTGILDKVIPGTSTPVGDYTIKELLDALNTVLVNP